MGLFVHLLGAPRLERDGSLTEPPRGHKAWGLLTYLVRTRVPPTREHLAGLLFSEADDPLGALRWTLSALRRQLGPDAELGGDPVRLVLAPGTRIDVDVLGSGTWTEAVSLPGFGRDLLEGLAFRSSPGFGLWLDSERRHVTGTTAAVLHHAALARLARSEVAGATAHASALVRLAPYDENAHVLLVRCLREAGDPAAAHRHVVATTARFERELGRSPSHALRAAAASPVRSEPPVPGRSGVLAQLEAAEAALAAGAVEAGIEVMRGAVAGARGVGDAALLARALVGLGASLVHAGRGTDEEGAAVLHEGTLLAEASGRGDVAARGWREIGWIQFLRAEYERAERSLGRIAGLDGVSEEERAWADVILGSGRHDLGDHEAAAQALGSALERSERLDTGQPLTLALTHLARLHLSRGEDDEACVLLDRALRVCALRGLTAFVPWPESFRGEVDLRRGDVDAAEARFEHAFALACQVGDPCWEGIAMRGLGLVAAARGETARAFDLLVQAPRQCRRLPDTYLWIEAYALEALCAVAVDHRSEAAPQWVDHFEAVAARRGLRELVVRALVHRARLGEPGALDAARPLAAQIANPALADLLGAATAR